MKCEYFQTYDNGNLLIRKDAEGTLEKADNFSQGCIIDHEIYRMDFGDMPVKCINEVMLLKYIGFQA